MIEDPDQRRLASVMLDHIADAIKATTLTYRHGPNAEGGWSIEAYVEERAW